MRSFRSLFALCVPLALGMLTGCGPTATSVAHREASRELHCPANKVDVSDQGSCTYAAQGCGRQGTFLVSAKDEGASGCCPGGRCRADIQGEVSAAPE